MNRGLIIVFILFVNLGAYAQQEPMYSQYMFNALTVNPAYAGSRKVISTSCIYRQQWLGIDGAPKTIFASFDTPVKKDKIGLGFTVTNDKIGITNQLNANFATSYQIQVFRKATMAFGLQSGITQFTADYASVDFSKTSTSLLPDQAFSTSVNKITPNFGAGLYLSSDKFYVGLSAPKLIKNSFNGAFSPSQDMGNFKYGLSRHYFLTAGYLIKLNEIYKLKPSFLIRAVSGAPLGIDINSNLWIKDILGIGISYRTSNALVGIVEVQLNSQLRFGYGYDYPLTKLSTVSSGSHEILVRYEFGFGRSDMKSPRYF